MIKAAVIGLGWWGKTILKNLLNSTVIAPVLAVDPLDQARASASALGIGTASRFEDALAKSSEQRIASMGLQNQIRVIHADCRTVDLGPADVVTMYLMTESNASLRPQTCSATR